MPKICPICNRSYSDDNAFCPADGTTLRADVTGDLIGSVIADRYLITDLLGEGGMGRVYLGRHVRLPQQAAIKVLRPDLVKDTASIARFNREATSASRIQSEYVARVFDFGETQDNLVYLAMEFVPGRTLRSLVQAEGPLPLPRTAAIISQIAEGLDAAHKLGIVHRDLKPDNVIITHDEEAGDRAKVVDFGIAKAVGSEKEGSQITSTGFVVGTPDYMSPEQLLNEQIDARSDVYALGLVAYNMLTAALPFESSTPSKGLMARLVDQPAPLSKSNPRGMWSLQVQQVFDTVLSRDIDKRYATAREFAHALRDSAGIAAPSFGPRTMSAGGMSAPASATGVGARPSATGVLEGAGSSATNEPVAATAGGGNKRMLIAGGILGALSVAAAAVFFLTDNGGDAGNVDQNPVSTVASSDTSRLNDGVGNPPAGGDTATGVSTPVNPTSPPVQGTTPPAGGNAGRDGATNGGADRPATNPPVENPPAAPRTPAVPSAALKMSIDSIMRVVDDIGFATDDAAVPAQSRAAIQRINTLLRQVTTNGDSARLLLLSANASKYAGDDKAACVTNERVRKMAKSDVDKRASNGNYDKWGCSSPWMQER